MTLTQLEYVVAVDKFRHFGKAAKSCFVTQPTLSMQLQKLEEELDLIIFDRSKNPIVPTLEGKLVIEQAKIVIKEHRKVAEIAQVSKNQVKGDFRLAVIPTLSPYVIPLFLKSFSENYPDVNLIIEECKTEDIITLLQSDKIDAGLLVTPLHDDTLIERVLFYEPFYLFVSPDHPLATKPEIHESDLSSEEIWLLHEGHCFRDQVLKLCQRKRPGTGTLPNVRFESGNLETIQNVILKNSGYTLLPHIAVNNLSPARRKHVRELNIKPVPTREISIVHSRTFLKEKIIDAIQQEIINNAPKELKSLRGKDVGIVEIL